MKHRSKINLKRIGAVLLAFAMRPICEAKSVTLSYKI